MRGRITELIARGNRRSPLESQPAAGRGEHSTGTSMSRCLWDQEETEAQDITQERSHVPIAHHLGSGGDIPVNPNPHTVTPRARWDSQAGSASQGAAKVVGARGAGTANAGRSWCHCPLQSHGTRHAWQEAKARQPDVAMGAVQAVAPATADAAPAALGQHLPPAPTQRSGFTETRLSWGWAWAPTVTQQRLSPQGPPRQ